MKVETSSYRDEDNDIIDDMDVEDSVFRRIVVLRNNDGRVTVRGKPRDGDTVEEEFQYLTKHRQLTRSKSPVLS